MKTVSTVVAFAAAAAFAVTSPTFAQEHAPTKDSHEPAAKHEDHAPADQHAPKADEHHANADHHEGGDHHKDATHPAAK